MECKEAYRLLCAYVDGELEQEKVPSLEEHLRMCLNCSEELEVQKAVKTLLREQFDKIIAPKLLRSRVVFELGRAHEYRESGIQMLDLIRWGTHIAQTYRTKKDLIEILVPYIGKGLEENELCVWATSEFLQEEATETLRKEIPNLQKYINSGQLQVIYYKDWYLPKGYFDARRVLDGGLKKYQEALSSGYSGLRITGNSSWLEQSDWDAFIEFENLLDSIIGENKLLIMCVYKENECTKNNMSDIMNCHEYVISKIGGLWSRREAV